LAINNQYAALLEDVLENGVLQPNRTGTDTLCVFGKSITLDVNCDNFPILTTKQVSFKTILDELLWFISGSTNISGLNSKIWDEWAKPDGNLGPIYGQQWAKQLPGVIAELRSNPTSRRLVVDSWQIADLDEMQLPPCHYSFVFGVVGDELNIMVSQRSVDSFLGLPYNLTSYSLLLAMVANVTGLKPGKLFWTGANVHLYVNHIAQARQQLEHPGTICAPTLQLPDVEEIWDYTRENIELRGYIGGPKLTGVVAV